MKLLPLTSVLQCGYGPLSGMTLFFFTLEARHTLRTAIFKHSTNLFDALYDLKIVVPHHNQVRVRFVHTTTHIVMITLTPLNLH